MKVSDLTAGASAHFYATYIKTLRDDESLMGAMAQGQTDMVLLMEQFPPEKLQVAYAAGKWTIAEVMVHITDSERVFQYRALRFSRGDKTALPGFDQDSYVPESNAHLRTKEQLLEEFMAVRQASLTLFASLTHEQLGYTGIASGLPWSVGALGFVISGHQRHHFNILKERYL